ncbi:small integral membrane protein 4 [Harpegnathos saltator]|uniref:small integral membrane protein 4 n=1 Tax=Harpegnathos saltator TaxID=610380 RepID=UPI000948AB97|nr:small integral membrane protein 4 [Harpegnathos saltator]
MYSRILRRLVKKLPGERYFGDFRILPLFFALGAFIEYSMIQWHVGETNFYKVYKRRQIEELTNKKLHQTTPIVDNKA